ncbi:MAG: MOSC N-terminal beta barrel domain-containing protein [Propionibacteriaceae bacterium]
MTTGRIEPAGITLTGITRYPVKSCRGQSLTRAAVEPWGLAGDRRWMLVDETGLTLTARQCPLLVLVVPFITVAGLVLTAPDMDPLRVSVPDGSTLVDVNVWGDPFQASLADDEASIWFRKVTGRNVRLVYLDDPTRRPVNSERSADGDLVSFADGFPLLLATEESLGALNDWIASGPRAADGPLPMTRFRPNLVAAGAPAWTEDTWRRVRIGDTTFRAVKACDRCVLTMVDPETALKTKEPMYTLARHRQWDHKTWFAINLIPDNFGGTLRVGDSVEVLEQSDDPTPQR